MALQTVRDHGLMSYENEADYMTVVFAYYGLSLQIDAYIVLVLKKVMSCSPYTVRYFAMQCIH